MNIEPWKSIILVIGVETQIQNPGILQIINLPCTPFMQDLFVDEQASKVREGAYPIDAQRICWARYILRFVPNRRSSASRVLRLLKVCRAFVGNVCWVYKIYNSTTIYREGNFCDLVPLLRIRRKEFITLDGLA